MQFKNNAVSNKKTMVAAVASAMAATAAGTAQAQLEEVIVTATKREASTQDIPIAVSALSEDSMNQMGIANFNDYLIQLPGITAGGSGTERCALPRRAAACPARA